MFPCSLYLPVFQRVISIKNYHPKIRIITQMLQYHNKVRRLGALHCVVYVCFTSSWPLSNLSSQKDYGCSKMAILSA